MPHRQIHPLVPPAQESCLRSHPGFGKLPCYPGGHPGWQNEIRKGEFYSNSGYDVSFIADYLSSQPINLDYSADKNIYLSFYYQPQGFGDSPEETDSLILEF